MLEKTYDPAGIESKQYKRWEEEGLFRAHPESDAPPYCIMMPPPNVTGSLHLGHALDATLQDVLIRYHRMRGENVLWQPGTDHAGIATQMVVERKLAEEGKDRVAMGREAFVARVWEWKEESGGTIIRQLRRLGASADWSRERFTMDEGLSRAVRTVFVRLHKEGLIYRDKRLVNWDCKLQTAVSDLEVVQTEVDGKLWYLRYPIEGEEGSYIVVATTRPETMLGDTAVAVHPEDERYRHLVGRHAILPLVGRRIPIVADTYSDPEKGTGAVKITPAHDFNDFEVGRRHDLPAVNVLDQLGRINDNAPEPYRGLDRFVARERVVADLEAQGLVARIEPYRHVVPHGDRSGTPIEPYLTDQWYCDAAKLAREAIRAVEDGRTRFVPKSYENVYFEWMRNIQPWCISRQLWWGHQIPAWYGPDGAIFVEMTAEEAAAAAERHYGSAVELVQDQDVLDTWFSSALWPFSTLGWPEETPELGRYYPTSVLVTGFDIIFFWVARMMMMGLHFMGEVPFRDVFIHGLIRDEKGQKMSKTKGNVIDPLDLVDTYGADALRFTLAAMTTQGRDVSVAESRVAGYRNFATKLWNAARFCQINDCRPVPDFDLAGCRLTLNRWLVGGVVRLAADVTRALDEYRFSDAAEALYHFTWHSFCDWHLELAKPVLGGDDTDQRAETQAATAWALAQILRLLHPMMPFVTEELHEHLTGGADGREGAPSPLMIAPWPALDDRLIDTEAAAEIEWTIRAVTAIRSVRAEMNVPASARLALIVRDANAQTNERLARQGDAMSRLARLGDVRTDQSVPGPGAVQLVVDEATFVLPLADVIDLDKERARLRRELDKVGGEIAGLDRRLANADFLSRAPQHVVEEQRNRRAEAAGVRQKLEAALARIEGA